MDKAMRWTWHTRTASCKRGRDTLNTTRRRDRKDNHPNVKLDEQPQERTTCKDRMGAGAESAGPMSLVVW